MKHWTCFISACIYKCFGDFISTNNQRERTHHSGGGSGAKAICGLWPTACNHSRHPAITTLPRLFHTFPDQHLCFFPLEMISLILFFCFSNYSHSLPKFKQPKYHFPFVYCSNITGYNLGFIMKLPQISLLHKIYLWSWKYISTSPRSSTRNLNSYLEKKNGFSPTNSPCGQWCETFPNSTWQSHSYLEIRTAVITFMKFLQDWLLDIPS